MRPAALAAVGDEEPKRRFWHAVVE